MAKTVQQYLSMPNVNTNCWQHWQKRGILRCKKSQSGHFQAQCIHLHIYLVLNQLQHTPHTTHTHLTALFPGLPRWTGTRKVKPIWILMKQETVSGSGISWDICKSAPHSRQITTPAPHRSVFYRPEALPATQPTASKHWRQTHHTLTLEYYTTASRKYFKKANNSNKTIPQKSRGTEIALMFLRAVWYFSWDSVWYFAFPCIPSTPSAQQIHDMVWNSKALSAHIII